MRRRVRRSPGEKLLAALLALAGQNARLVRQKETSWASITFAGTRHLCTLEFTGSGLEDGERFIDVLPDHEFTIPGQLVADAVITEVDHTLSPSPRLTVTCELLLLEES